VSAAPDRARAAPFRACHRAAVSCVLAGLLPNALAAPSVPQACAGRPDIVAPCFDVGGRLNFRNGTPSARIWSLGTRRMLGIHHDELPAGLPVGSHDFATEIRGTFNVCPFTREQAGHMQFVCIESWSDVFIRQRHDNAETS
jgi:hypothetical protein